MSSLVKDPSEKNIYFKEKGLWGLYEPSREYWSWRAWLTRGIVMDDRRQMRKYYWNGYIIVPSKTPPTDGLDAVRVAQYFASIDGLETKGRPAVAKAGDGYYSEGPEPYIPQMLSDMRDFEIRYGKISGAMRGRHLPPVHAQAAE